MFQKKDKNYFKNFQIQIYFRNFGFFPIVIKIRKKQKYFLKLLRITKQCLFDIFYEKKIQKLQTFANFGRKKTKKAANFPKPQKKIVF